MSDQCYKGFLLHYIPQDLARPPGILCFFKLELELVMLNSESLKCWKREQNKKLSSSLLFIAALHHKWLMSFAFSHCHFVIAEFALDIVDRKSKGVFSYTDFIWGWTELKPHIRWSGTEQVGSLQVRLQFAKGRMKRTVPLIKPRFPWKSWSCSSD